MDITQLSFALVALMYTAVVGMHLSKRSSWTVALYCIQSIALVILLSLALTHEFSWLLVIATLAVALVKIVMAPRFFMRLIARHEVKFSASTYLNGPMTLVVLALLTAVTHAKYFLPLTTLAPEAADAILLSLSTMLTSFFLVINKKGALSHMTGILSLENAIVAFATITGLEQTPALQLGVLFDIGVWVLIASVFANMIYQTFGSLEVSNLTELTEE